MYSMHDERGDKMLLDFCLQANFKMHATLAKSNLHSEIISFSANYNNIIESGIALNDFGQLLRTNSL